MTDYRSGIRVNTVTTRQLRQQLSNIRDSTRKWPITCKSFPRILVFQRRLWRKNARGIVEYVRRRSSARDYRRCTRDFIIIKLPRREVLYLQHEHARSLISIFSLTFQSIFTRCIVNEIYWLFQTEQLTTNHWTIPHDPYLFPYEFNCPRPRLESR